MRELPLGRRVAGQRFDHVGKSGFALRAATNGSRASVHVKNLEAALPKDLRRLPQKTTRSAGRLGTSCGDCHSDERVARHGPSITRRSRNFRCVGKHAALACQTCHANGVDGAARARVRELPCRRSARGQLGARCDSCHGQSAWPRKSARPG